MGRLIFQWAYRDYAGVCSKISEALTAAGHECVLFASRPSVFDYGSWRSSRNLDRATILAMKRADLIIAHTYPNPPVWGRGKRVLYVHGSRYRRHHGKLNADADRAGCRVVTSTVELTRYKPDSVYSPTPINQKRLAKMWRPPRRGPLRVAHSPSSRDMKGTREFVDVVNSLDGVEAVVIEGVNNKECLKRKATCHVSFDSFEIGLQVSSVEAMAMGMPAITGGDARSVRDTKRLMGRVPFLWADTPEKLRLYLANLRDSASLREEWGRISSRYIEEHHDYPAAVRRMEALWLGE